MTYACCLELCVDRSTVQCRQTDVRTVNQEIKAFFAKEMVGEPVWETGAFHRKWLIIDY